MCMREDNVQCTSRPASGKYYIPALPLQSTMSTPLQCSTLHPTLPVQSTIPTPAANMIENVQTLFQYRRRRIFKVLQQSYNLQTNKQTKTGDQNQYLTGCCQDNVFTHTYHKPAYH